MGKDLEFDSPVLDRLIEEVRNDIKTGEVNNYNRMHNRHNRSRGHTYSYEEKEAFRKTREERDNFLRENGAEKHRPNGINCTICEKPLEADATRSEKVYFISFGQHKQCVHKDYVRGSE